MGGVSLAAFEMQSQSWLTMDRGSALVRKNIGKVPDPIQIAPREAAMIKWAVKKKHA
jgi:hypothetical protein